MMTATATPALEVRGLTKHFGGIIATDNVTLAVAPGTRHALIGPNGAGKTTLINQLTGLVPPSAGRILLAGEDITGMSAPQRVKRGIARTFQINQLFGSFTVLEALLVATTEAASKSGNWLSPVQVHSAAVESAVECARQFLLTDILNERVSTLPYGKQRLLEIALAVACRPRLLLLDEPAAGVPEGDRQEILAAVGRLPKDVTVLLIEHDMDLVFRFASRITVLVNGAVFAEGSPEEIAADPRVRSVYLGEGDHG
jgi:ABC-type branched-subunit amino acid transport system ATPase component